MKKNVQTVEDFGINQLEKITLKSGDLKVEILTLGATVYSIEFPDEHGKIDDLVLGYPKWVDYLTNKDFLGCIAGRFANRIANAQFQLNGNTYNVTANEGTNCLHGGDEGIHKKFYSIDQVSDDSVTLSSVSPDGEDGFPGKLNIKVTYTVSENTLKMKYEAETDKDTVVNLTNHSYFNLAGHNSGSVLEHEIEIDSDKYLPVDKNLIPGELEPIKNSPFEYKTPRPFSYSLRAPHDQVKTCGGVDHCFVLNTRGLKDRACKVVHPFSGRVMEVFTTEPGVQCYTANHIDGLDGKKGALYGKFPAFCLETQHFPDSPNRPDFPSTVLKAGKKFTSETHYKFGTLS